MGVCVYPAWYDDLVVTVDDFGRIIHLESQDVSLADRSDAIVSNKKGIVQEDFSILVDSNYSCMDEKSRAVAVIRVSRHLGLLCLVETLFYFYNRSTHKG